MIYPLRPVFFCGGIFRGLPICVGRKNEKKMSEARSRRRAEATQPSPSKPKAGTAAEVTGGSSLDTVTSAKRPLPDEGTAVLNEPSTSRMRPASTASTASDSPDKRKSTHQVLPEAGAHSGEESAPPGVPASKYAHGTLRPGADGKSQWRVEEQPGGAACCWQRVFATEPRNVRRPPVLAVKRPLETEAPSGSGDVMPTAQAAAALTEGVSLADSEPSHAKPSSASSSAEPAPPQVKRKPGRPPKLGAKPALAKLEAKPGTRPMEPQEQTQQGPTKGDTQPPNASLVSSHLSKQPSKVAMAGKGDTQPTKGSAAKGGRPTEESPPANTDSQPPDSSKLAAGSKRPLPPPSEGSGEGGGAANSSRREAVGLPPSNSRLGRPPLNKAGLNTQPKQLKAEPRQLAWVASASTAAVSAAAVSAAAVSAAAGSAAAGSVALHASSAALRASTSSAALRASMATALPASVTTAAERVRAGLEKAAIKCHSCGGVKPARNAKCMVETTAGGDVGTPCPGGELGYKARLRREREAALLARARTKERTLTLTLTLTLTPTLTPTPTLTLTRSVS